MSFDISLQYVEGPEDRISGRLKTCSFGRLVASGFSGEKFPVDLWWSVVCTYECKRGFVERRVTGRWFPGWPALACHLGIPVREWAGQCVHVCMR